jgi:alpha-tubulin suppressor-like RCC1 family protein
MALDASGNLWAWGGNDLGQAGRITDSALVVAPGRVALGDVVAFATAGNHSLALWADGKVWRWGSNERGQLALNLSTGFSAEPLLLSDFVAAGRGVVAGVQSSAVLQVPVGAPTRVWGMGAVGDGSYYGSVSWPPSTGAPSGPVDIAGMTLVRGSFGVAHSLAIRDNGRVYAWGYNGMGQLGLGDTVARLEPAQVPGLIDVVKVQAGLAHSAALTLDGRVFTWGLNDTHQLGGNAPQHAEISTPRPVPLPAVIIDIACGDTHCLALAFDGRVFGWGGNRFGQVGDGTTADVATPREITGPDWSARAMAIGAGRHHSLAADAGGAVWAWGNNGAGQLGEPIAQVLQRNQPVRVPGGPSLIPGP